MPNVGPPESLGDDVNLEPIRTKLGSGEANPVDSNRIAGFNSEAIGVRTVRTRPFSSPVIDATVPITSTIPVNTTEIMAQAKSNRAQIDAPEPDRPSGRVRVW